MVLSPRWLSPWMWRPTFDHIQGKAGCNWSPHRRNSSPGFEALMVRGLQALGPGRQSPVISHLSADSGCGVVSLAWLRL